MAHLEVWISNRDYENIDKWVVEGGDESIVIKTAVKLGSVSVLQQYSFAVDNHRADCGGTLLHHICRSNDGEAEGQVESSRKELIEYLIEKGTIDPTARNDSGQTAEELTACKEIRSVLQTSGQAVASQNSSDKDPVTEAAFDYLNRVVFPKLSPAINEVAAIRPADPIAHLISLLSEGRPQHYYSTPARQSRYASSSAYSGQSYAPPVTPGLSALRQHNYGGV